MRKKIIAGLLIVLLFGSSSVNVFAKDNKVLDTNYSSKVSAKQMLNGKKYAKDELIVTFKKNLSTNTINNIIESEDADLEKTIIISDKKAAKVEISEEDTLTKAIVKFQSNPNVELVQPNYKYSIIESAKIKGEVSNDIPQYHFDITKAKEAWNYIETRTYETTKVSVIDTGVDVLHVDLQANLSSTTEYVKTVGGLQIIGEYDTGDHGTHVSGIIGATSGNGGVTGIASGNNNDLVEVLAVGSSADGESLFTSDIIAAINYSKTQRAKVINMSFGSDGRDRALESTIKSAYNDGIVFVAASGNEETDIYSSPSDFKEVISVNASNENNEATYWSNYGVHKDITAPGNNIVSTTPNDYYETMSGTSMASPIVAGIVALMLDINPDLTPAEVYNILCASTSKTTFDNYLGYGIVDAKKAVQAADDASELINVSSLTIKEDFIQLGENDTFGLETLIRPATSLKDITWSSANEDIATVNETTGEVTGVAKGITTITATADGKTVSCDVRVIQLIEPTDITIINKNIYSSIVKGTTVKLKASIEPKNSENKEVYWSSTNPNIVDINDYGQITANDIGTATITAKTYDGRLSDSVQITVTNEAREIEFTSSISKILIGETFAYQARSLDEDGIPLSVNNGIVWKSSNSSVATINRETGVVTPKKAGITYIEAIDINTENNEMPIIKSKLLTVGRSDYSGSIYGLRVIAKDYNSVTINWATVLVAQNYVIERATSLNGTYKVIKTQTSTTYKDTGLSLNKLYYYRIKAVYSASKSFGYSSKVAARTALKAPTLNLYNTKGYALKLKWNKINGASGYMIYRYNPYAKKYVAIKNIKSGSTLLYVDSDLKTKRYYYKIKAYKIVKGTKIYSPYSNTRSVVVW